MVQGESRGGGGEDNSYNLYLVDLGFIVNSA